MSSLTTNAKPVSLHFGTTTETTIAMNRQADAVL
jgi:hypothetical protein